MTADNVMNPQRFVSDPADIQILWINPEIRIHDTLWNDRPGHFWLRLDALIEVCTLWAQSSIIYQY